MEKARPKRRMTGAIFFVSLVLFGFLSVIVIRSQTPATAAETQTEKDTVIAMIHQVEAENEKITAAINAIKQEIDAKNHDGSGGEDALQTIQKTTDARKAAAGFDTMQAAGISITLNDNSESAARALEKNPENYHSENYIVHDKNLLYLINDLRPYADAIAVNGQRIITTSSIRCVGTVIMVDQIRLAPPYRIEVAGEPEKLMEHLKKSVEYDLIMDSELLLTVSVENTMEIPAYNGTVSRDYTTTKGNFTTDDKEG